MPIEVALIANPAAGAGRAAQRAGVLATALRAHGVAARVVLPCSAQDTERQAGLLAAEGIPLVACGGDGTANLVMNACLAHGVAFGLLPAGSGDDNARSLGVPQDPGAAGRSLAEALRGGATARQVDVAVATCADGTRRAFLGVMSTGIDSTVNERANGYARLPGTARYVAALAIELQRMRPVEYTVIVDGVEHRQPALLASIGNGGSYGGGMRICPQARVDDGLLDVTILAHVPRATFVRVFPSVFRGTHVRHPAVTTARGSVITVRAEGGLAYADGERFGPLPVSVAVEPKALRLIGTPTA